jgi:hypothetical protein
MPYRVFTVEEANALVPHLTEVMARVEVRRVEIQRLHDKLQVLEALWGERVLELGNPDREEALLYHRALESCVRGLEETVEQGIIAHGLRFPRGGIENGLVDFLTTWEGRWVYLCWHRGEPAVQAWHEVREGFAGRRALTAEHERRMGRESDPSRMDDSALDF